jgi:spore coat protein JB
MMNSERLELLFKIMALDFTLIDFNLYLDTHPRDRRALEDRYETLEEVKPLKEEYVKCYGPLTHYDQLEDETHWRWINEPWPWEVTF